MSHDERPIGYWLKHCHDLLTAFIDSRQAAHGVRRVEWQVLSVMRKGGADAGKVHALLAPFADAEELDAVLAGLRRRVATN